MPRVAALIVRDGTVALIERRRTDRHYYLSPGGGVEPDETDQEALAREVREELGLEVRVGRLVAR